MSCLVIETTRYYGIFANNSESVTDLIKELRNDEFVFLTGDNMQNITGTNFNNRNIEMNGKVDK